MRRFTIRAIAEYRHSENRVDKSRMAINLGCDEVEVLKDYYDTHTGRMNKEGTKMYISTMAAGIAVAMHGARERGLYSMAEMREMLLHHLNASLEAVKKAQDVTSEPEHFEDAMIDPRLN